MGGSLNEPERPAQSPVTAGQARPVTLSVVIDGRLDAVRARQVATLTDRLGLAGVWLRQPWWPTDGPVMSTADAADLLAELVAGGRVRAGLIADGQLVSPAGSAGGPGDEFASAVFVPCFPGRDLAAEISAAAARGGPVLAEVTVSVGRTAAEAQARADDEQLFTLAGHPERQGLFGTLEECQVAASRLAHAGVTELVCCLPLVADLPDVLAQLRSIAIGAGVLRPGEPPSAPPPPPEGWGGRRLTA